MWLKHSNELDKVRKFYIGMSRERFDKLMCTAFPDLFSERNKPMSETCMCWGFDIGPGWYWILADLCQKITVIQKATGITVTFTQIKEKFAGGRFYHGIHRKAIFKNEEIEWDDKENAQWEDILDNEVNKAQDLCEYVCAKCGEYKHDVIYIGRWAYDLCEKCLLEERPESKKGLEDWKMRKELKNGDFIWLANKKELAAFKKLSKSVDIRIKKEYKDIMKKYKVAAKKK